MRTDRERRIEERAYELWEAEGHPQGKHEEHWHRAAREIDGEKPVTSTTKSRSRRAPQRAPAKRA
ncbi:MAG: DUF2934 domain-containing protein [Alphaproteobacteria bacterium]|nr:DUF2934 domain-containing protein [Alphaproteobacteria bacterium]MBV8335812.1 DUF2934 domain-containing protein [Alphaproteobacteria bacterium]